ncbi:MAG: HigA family addiction module antitoxin [Candidatus Methylumidiphilus sp.]
MLPSHRITTHPGVILQEEFLEPMCQTPQALAKHIGLSEQMIEEILGGKRGIQPETAWLLALLSLDFVGNLLQKQQQRYLQGLR